MALDLTSINGFCALAVSDGLIKSMYCAMLLGLLESEMTEVRLIKAWWQEYISQAN